MSEDLDFDCRAKTTYTIHSKTNLTSPNIKIDLLLAKIYPINFTLHSIYSSKCNLSLILNETKCLKHGENFLLFALSDYVPNTEIITTITADQHCDITISLVSSRPSEEDRFSIIPIPKKNDDVWQISIILLIILISFILIQNFMIH